MLISTLIGSGTFGVVVNFVSAETVLLKNAWGKISSLFLLIAFSPMIYLYNLKIKRIEEEKHKIKELEEEQDKLEFYIESHFTG